MESGPDLATAETEHGPATPTGPTGAVDPLGRTASTGAEFDGDAATESDRPRGPARREATPAAIGKYVVLGRLGQGGMGTVYAVYNPDLDRKSVIKLVRPDHAGDSGQRRLLREARLLATLSHPNVVQVHDSGLHDGDVYVVMEFIAGVTFDAWRRRGPHPWPQVLAVHAQAGLGLAAAHARGIVHRDYTPRNAMLGDDGRAVVLDFGLSHGRGAPGPVSGAAPAEANAEAPEGESTLTHAGAIVGTPRYMSPEQLRGAPTDARSDQFSFCVVLWEALFDRLPYAGDNIHVYNGAVLDGALAAPDELRGVPRPVLEALRRGLSPEPERRFPDMHALLAALQPAPARDRRGLALAWVAVAVGLALGLWGLSTRPPSPAERCAAELADAPVWDTGPLATDPPGGRARLDAIAERWRATRRDLCAARLGGALPDALHRRGLRCLEAHRAVLVRVGEQLRAGATLDLAELPDPERLAACADPANLSPETDPATPRAREDAREIADALDRARAALIVGRYRDSEALAADAVRRARALDHGPTLAAALYQLARARSYGERAAAAEPALREAAALAVAHDLHELAADAYLRLLRVAALAGERPQDGRLWYSALAGHLARLDERDGPREAEAREYLGDVARREGDLAAARVEYERALAGRAGAWAFLRTPALVGLARVDLAEGDHAAAGVRFAEALRIVEAELGPAHPKLVPPLFGLAQAHLAAGRHEPAAAAIDRARALLGDPPAGPLAAAVEYRAAEIAELRGDLPRARALAEAARRALRAPGLPPEVAGYTPRVLDLAARMAYETGEPRAALPPYVELLHTVAGRRADDPVALRLALGNAAEIAAQLGEHALALRFAAAARPILADVPDVAPALARELAAELALIEGQALLAVGRRGAAARALEEALHAWDRGGDPDDPRAAALSFTLFSALRDDAPGLARPWAVRAHDALARQTPSPRDRLDVLSTWLRTHAH